MAIRWVEVTEEKFHEILGVLPPASMGGAGFQVGEAMNHNAAGKPTFASFCERDGKYWESSEALTFREFKAEFPGAEYYYD